MAEARSEMARAVRSLETTKNAKDYLPTFFNRNQRRKEPGVIQAWVMAHVSTELLIAFDLHGEWPENYATLCAAKLVATGFCEKAEAEGYAPDLCSYSRNTMGYLRREREEGVAPAEAPIEGMGNPAMLLGSSVLCDPRYKWFQAVSTHYGNIPIFADDTMSPVWDVDVDDPRLAEHYKAQLRESFKAQIAFLGKITGKGFDADQFREIMAYSQEALKYWIGTLDLRRAVPCPMNAEDYFTAIIPQLYMLGHPEAVDYYKALYNEVKARIDRGEGVIPDEKCRLVWFGLPPWFNLGIFNWLESLGAVFPIESVYYPGPYVEVNITDPVEALVERTWRAAVIRLKNSSEGAPELCFPGPANSIVPTKTLLRWVEEYKLDGAVMHRTLSCRATTVGEVHAKNELAKAGIPSLIFESDMADPRAWSDAQIKTRFTEFLETVETAKAKRQKR